MGGHVHVGWCSAGNTLTRVFWRCFGTCRLPSTAASVFEPPSQAASPRSFPGQRRASRQGTVSRLGRETCLQGKPNQPRPSSRLKVSPLGVCTAKGTWQTRLPRLRCHAAVRCLHHTPGRHMGDQVDKVKKNAAPLFLKMLARYIMASRKFF